MKTKEVAALMALALVDSLAVSCGQSAGSNVVHTRRYHAEEKRVTATAMSLLETMKPAGRGDVMAMNLPCVGRRLLTLAVARARIVLDFNTGVMTGKMDGDAAKRAG